MNWFSPPIILALLALVLRVHCLSAIQGSPCYDTCNGNQTTSSGDIVCTDEDFANTTKGQIWQKCLTCLQTSDYKSGWMTDSTLLLYYLSSVQQTCLSRKPAAPISDCSTDCGNISSAFSGIGGRNFFQTPWSYCTASNSVYQATAAQCATCLQIQVGTVILGNFVYVGDVGCDSQPDVASGDALYTKDDLFNPVPLSSEGSASSSRSGASSTKTASAASASSNSTASATSTTSSTSTRTGTSSASQSAATEASATAVSSSTDGDASDNNGNASLSRGAAAGIGIAIGLIGVVAVIFFAVLARRRVRAKQGNVAGGAWNKMRDSPTPNMKQIDVPRGVTPPAAGVFVAPPIPPVPKSSKSFKSLRSLKNMTPRTSEWYYAANPKKSSDLSALPQRRWK